ncbi:hypothetical protein VU12_04985 [Desulfobulbus sp. US4]|nr:hypothetical protein [Desulfobulbus sp. US4]
MKKKLLSVVCCAVLAVITGCDSGGSDDDDGGIVQVSYSLQCNDEPVCHNVTAKQVNINGTGSYSHASCSWNCSSYNGQEGVQVILKFVKYGEECWQITEESIASGICD